MMPCHAFNLLAMLALLPLARCHMNMMLPESRVTLAWGSRSPRLCTGNNCNYEPQSVSSAINQAPNGICGDPKQEVGGLWWTAGQGRPGGTYTQGGLLTITGRFTAFHMGRSIARICRFSGDERASLTNDCLNQNVLRLASGDQAGQTAWYHGAGTAPISDSATFQLPAGLWCDGVQWKCVLQFRYQTGNTCTPQGTPTQFANRALPVCATENSMEQFWQCADIVITPSGGPVPPASPKTAPPVVPSPAPTPKSPAPTPKSPAPAPKSPAPAPKSPAPAGPCGTNPTCFCQGKAAGMYADVANGCSAYFWCAATGAWYQQCPKSSTGQQLLFNNARQYCDWPNQVACASG